LKIATEITEITEKTLCVLRVLCGENFHPTAGKRQALMMNSSANSKSQIANSEWRIANSESVIVIAIVDGIFIPPPGNRRSTTNSSENQSLFHAKAQRRKVKNKALASLASLRDIVIPPLVNRRLMRNSSENSLNGLNGENIR